MKLSKIFKKPIKLTAKDQVLVAQERVAHAFEMFIEADQELSNANMELMAIISSEKERLENVQKILDQAHDELKANNALKARLSDFIPKV